MELPHTIDHAYGIVIATLSFIGYSDAAQQLVPSLHGRMISEPVRVRDTKSKNFVVRLSPPTAA
jgi:hypothetical protein